MADEPENLVLRYLRRLDERFDRLDGRRSELTQRVSDMYGAVVGLRRDALPAEPQA